MELEKLKESWTVYRKETNENIEIQFKEKEANSLKERINKLFEKDTIFALLLLISFITGFSFTHFENKWQYMFILGAMGIVLALEFFLIKKIIDKYSSKINITESLKNKKKLLLLYRNFYVIINGTISILLSYKILINTSISINHITLIILSIFIIFSFITYLVYTLIYGKIINKIKIILKQVEDKR